MIGLSAPVLVLYLVFSLKGQCLSAPNAALEHSYNVREVQYSDGLQDVLGPAESSIRALSAATPTWGTSLPRPTGANHQWILECDSDTKDHECRNATDGNPQSTWRSKPSSSDKPEDSDHYIQVNFTRHHNIYAVRMVPSPNWNRDGGSVAGHRIHLSEDGHSWQPHPVAYGTWFDDGTNKWAYFEPQRAMMVRLLATSATRNRSFITLAELDFWAVSSTVPVNDSLGRWGPTINFPVVPVAAFVDPRSHKVVAFASDTHDGQGTTDPDRQHKETWTAIWEPLHGNVSRELVVKTGHDMFCPGMAFDVNGSMIISGGETAPRTSTFNGTDGGLWISLANMNIPRGYQGSATIADGRVFVIGGSWSPKARQHRYGELYDPSRDKWDTLNKCPSEDIQTTQDRYTEYRGDNHVWLLSWKDNTLFQAGPAAQMHWIHTEQPGKLVKAGIRKKAGMGEANDAMCGIAVMYDAEAGEILTAGGARQYEIYTRLPPDDKLPKSKYGKPASKDAFIIKLGAIDKEPAVVSAGEGMHYARTFTNAVVLPNGETFVAGGMLEGEPFSDESAELRPEMYSPGTWPATGKWTVMQPNSIARTYHSFALLLEDATVLVGGGGLWGGLPLVNHFDAQVYTPPYLLRGGARPKITRAQDAVHLGANLHFTTDGEVTDASLIRYGGATHTVNNDQRRIKLRPSPVGAPAEFHYQVTIPKEAGVAIPGYWMLFVLNEAGVPSVAKTVHVLCTECKVMGPKTP